MYVSRKYKTVTYENRCQIQEILKNNKSITIMEIAEGEVIKMENDKAINCLMELLKGENFMSADYTNIALQNGTNLNVLREIYLCACDKISVKDVQEVIDNRKTDIAGYLRKIRYQKACGVIIGKGNNTLKDMSKLADAVQAKINTLGESIMTVEKKTGELSDMFVDIKPPQGAVTMPYAGVQQTATADVKREDEKTASFKRKRLKRRQKTDIAEYISLLKEEGYKSEQISYVLSLAEKGVTPAEMEEFIHPGISVDMMEKIRLMKKKTRNKDVEES